MPTSIQHRRSANHSLRMFARIFILRVLHVDEEPHLARPPHHLPPDEIVI
jgi:hypothetical protein